MVRIQDMVPVKTKFLHPGPFFCMYTKDLPFKTLGKFAHFCFSFHFILVADQHVSNHIPLSAFSKSSKSLHMTRNE
jgi:hypothetical protein